MQLTAFQHKILNAEICPYCLSGVTKRPQEYVYGKSYRERDLYVCNNFPVCDSYVGSHEDGKPLGRLANSELRKAKKLAHFYFDQLWQEKGFNRSECYKMLSEYLNIPIEYTHIGMFQFETCIKVIEFSKTKLSDGSK